MKEKNVKLVVLRLLSVKSLSVLELRKKLILRGFLEEEISQAISLCRQYGYLNDDDEAHRRNKKLIQKGYGPHFIHPKLHFQGLKTPSMSSEDQIKVIQKLIEKPAWKKKEKRQTIAALKRRGFDFECILAVTKSIETFDG